MSANVLAQNINMWITRNRMTQRDLANKIGATEVTVSRYCNGKRIPKATVLYQMSRVFGCTMEDLMAGVDNEEGQTFY